MEDGERTREQLVSELEVLREKVTALETQQVEFRRSKEKQEEELYLLQTVIDALPLPVLYKDAVGSYLGCNKAYEAHLSLSKKEIVGKCVFDVAPKELAEKCHDVDVGLLREAGNRKYEARVTYADGRKHDVIIHKASIVDRNGGLVGLVGIMEDITERKRAEEMFSKAFHMSPHPICLTRSPDGYFIDVNRSFSEQLGYSRSNYTPDGIERDRNRTAKSLSIIRQHPFWYAGVMLNRMGEMLKYSAQAPLVYGVSEARSLDRTAPFRKEWRAMDTNASSLAVGESTLWMRPLVRPIQRLTKEAMQLMIALGALALFIASWRRALFIWLVPMYYLLFQSFVHTEFRFTVPMQYFVFVFAATAWVALFSAICQVVRTVINKKAGSKQPLAAG